MLLSVISFWVYWFNIKLIRLCSIYVIPKCILNYPRQRCCDKWLDTSKGSQFECTFDLTLTSKWWHLVIIGALGGFNKRSHLTPLTNVANPSVENLSCMNWRLSDMHTIHLTLPRRNRSLFCTENYRQGLQLLNPPRSRFARYCSYLHILVSYLYVVSTSGVYWL